MSVVRQVIAEGKTREMPSAEGGGVGATGKAREKPSAEGGGVGATGSAEEVPCRHERKGDGAEVHTGVSEVRQARAEGKAREMHQVQREVVLMQGVVCSEEQVECGGGT